MDAIKHRIRVCDYLTVAELFLQDNFLLDRPLAPEDIKPRLLGHWGTCHGINVVYANLAFWDTKYDFVLGPGHGFPALNANLFVDGELLKYDNHATQDYAGIAYLCKNFSWPGGFPSHASPLTPNVICEGGELGYALATAYGAVLGHPEKHIAVLIGDGELETATALSSLNLNKLVGGAGNGKILPILHLNGYKISAPTIYGRKSERELNELIRGFGFSPITVDGDAPEDFQSALATAESKDFPFIILKTKKGSGCPAEVNNVKCEGNYVAHQIPLPLAKTDETQLRLLEDWLKSYKVKEFYA